MLKLHIFDSNSKKICILAIEILTALSSGASILRLTYIFFKNIAIYIVCNF